MTTDRSLIFISHANPADNDFTIWLASRLVAAGYNVWADLNDLRAGARHWRDIEKKIRNEAIRVLVVTSRASREAEGVENEINIAKGVEKENGYGDFIIQLKIDDLPYTQLPPPLNNRLALAFEENWGSGLADLLRELREQEVPRPNCSSQSTDFYAAALAPNAGSVVAASEPVIASWLPVSLPEYLYVYYARGRAATCAGRLVETGIAAEAMNGLLVSFASPDTVGYCCGTDPGQLNGSRFALQAWNRDFVVDGCSLSRADRRSCVSALVNAAWEMYVSGSGLKEYRLADERAFFVPSPAAVEIKQPYTDPLGRATRPVKLVGMSNKYAALWHAAISTRYSAMPFPILSVRLHVAFTDDGQAPIADGKKAFRLRRSFCKQFFNDRWRRIYLAMLSYLRQEHQQISLATGGSESIVVRPPMSIGAGYSIAGDNAMEGEDDAPDDTEQGLGQEGSGEEED